ncbi:tetratricopeptide repeat protein [Chitinophagaceae bacterium LWZ2-11]
MYLKKRILFSIAFCAGVLAGNAQYTMVNNDPDADFKLAKELYQKQQYSLAYPVFKNLYSVGVSADSKMPVTVELESKYYYIICGLKLNDATAVPMAVDFINLEHHSPRIQMMSFHLGEYYFRKKNFGEAVTYYDKAGIDNLSNSEIAEMKFHKAYCHFTMQQFAEAKPLFNAIRQIPSDPNYYDANYYYGFISFYDKNYKDALAAFTLIQTQPAYQNIVPFYIAEIYYFTGNKEKALDYSERALKKGGQYYDVQLKQLAGHLLFEKKEYARALPYLAEYVKKTEKVSREDLYELSYCYYEASNWTKSIEGFKQLGGKEDSLAQNSMYLLADAYLKTGQKSNARNAFLFCASNNSNPTQKEISSFTYAKLSYELGYLDVALKELQDFITDYSDSPNVPEAKEILVGVLANTSNYKDALVLFEKIQAPSETVKKLYPGILYGRAVELINDQQIIQADELLDKLIKSPYNSKQLQATYFWKGEIAYRSGRLDEAEGYLTNYLKSPQTNGEVNVKNARYDLGYCLLKAGQYKEALSNFEQVAKGGASNASSIEQDAYVRMGDCYFMNKDYKQALKVYEDVIAANGRNADYALYQKAVIAGAQNRGGEKVSLMKSLVQRYPNTSLLADANLEIANTYLADEKFDDALIPLQAVLKNKDAEALYPQAYLKTGVSYFNLNKNDEALTNFKKLVATYPNSQESDEAVEYIRNIYVAQQNAPEFVNFMKQNGKQVSVTEEDSLTYRSAMLRYDSKDFAGAKAGFTDYLAKFPTGKYNVEANYFTAEIFINNKDPKAALPYYAAVALKAPNKYAERSTLQAARIDYFDFKDYAKAAVFYEQLKSIATQQENKLEAMRGLLRCQYKMQDWKNATVNAQDLLQEKGAATDDKIMANMIVAKNYQADSALEQASASYKTVVALGKTEYAAEAQYRIAEILFLQNKLPDAEKASFDVIKKAGSYEYWVTKSYLLLGDIYLAEKDLFNAEATYKSVADNAVAADLKAEAQQKLAQVVELKNKTNKVEH